MENLVLGIFSKHEDADATLIDLANAGFVSDEISVMARTEEVERYRKRDISSDAIATGGILGGLAGLFIAVTPIVLPGVGILVAGPLTALASMALGAVAGGTLGALVDLGVSEAQARSYEKRIQEGAILVGVTVDDTTEAKAVEIMRKHNAEELTIVPYTQEAKSSRQEKSTYARAAVKGGKSTAKKR